MAAPADPQGYPVSRAESPMRFQFFPGLDSLPEGVAELWQGDATESFFLSRWWLETVISAGLDPGDTVALGVLMGDDGRALALLPGQFSSRRGASLGARTFRGLTGMYSCLFRPILARDGKEAETATLLGRYLGSALATNEVLHLDAMDSDWPLLPAFEGGLAEAGLRARRYDHFGNWSEEIGERTMQDYLGARDGALREILRRRERALAQRGASYEVVASESALADGLTAYETVYAQSWKVPEPYPKFQEASMRHAARAGALRLGLCRTEGRPVAAQLWIVWRKRGTVLKLAHDESLKKLSAGTVLTGYMIRHLLESDAVTAIDFGRGDDPYKRQWATQRRQRIGLIAANPRSLVELGVLARQSIGRWLSALRS